MKRVFRGFVWDDMDRHWTFFGAKESVHCGVSTQSRCFVFFSLGSSGYLLGCTIGAVSAQRQVEHVKHAIQNITTEWTPHSVVNFH